MNNQQNILWKKLNLSLDLLSVSDPSSILPTILVIQEFISNENYDTYLKKINFMAFELQSRCNNLNERDRKTLLSDYIFNEKGFLISHLSNKTIDENDWYIDKTIDKFQGVSFLISLIYIHFAQILEIPIYLINSNSDHILKWIDGKSSTYLDITQSTTNISDKKMCEMIVKMNAINKDIPLDCFDIITSKQIIKKYLCYLLNIYNIKKKSQYTKKTLDILLKIEPSNLNFLKQRALVNKKLQLNRQAIEDIRKYFSLNGENSSPKELKMAYYELKNLTTPKSTLLH